MKKLMVLLVVFSVLLVTACAPPGGGGEGTKVDPDKPGGDGGGEPGEAKGITIAMTAPWDSYVPFNSTTVYSDTVFDLLYDRLIFMQADGSYTSRLADSWDRNDDFTEITFHLNKDAKWHDGQSVTADDVVFTANVYSHPDISVARRSMMNSVAGTDNSGMQAKEGDIQVEAIDAHTVKFTLKEASPTDFLLSLRFREVFIIPKHIYGGAPIAEILQSEAWLKPIGSGPYKYVSEIAGERIQFEANEDYFLGAPQAKNLVLRVVDASNLVSGLINNEIDLSVDSIPLDDWENTKTQANLTTKSVQQHGYQYMTINTQKPYLTQKVRNAIDLAINRERIVDQLLLGEGEVAAGPMSVINPYFNKALLPVVYDQDAAKKMLEEENFPFDQVLLMSVPKGNIIRERASLLIQQDLAAIGIQTEIKTSDFPTHMEILRNGEYDLGLIGSGGPIDPSQSVLDLTPGHINNFSQNQDPTLGDIGGEGQTKLTFEERQKVYDHYQMVLKEQAPFLFLYYPNVLVAYNSRLENVKAENFPLRNMNISEWIVK